MRRQPNRAEANGNAIRTDRVAAGHRPLLKVRARERPPIVQTSRVDGDHLAFSFVGRLADLSLPGKMDRATAARRRAVTSVEGPQSREDVANAHLTVEAGDLAKPRLALDSECVRSPSGEDASLLQDIQNRIGENFPRVAEGAGK